MNVLQSIQAYCYESNLKAPSVVVASTDPNHLQLLHLLYAVGRDLRERFNYPTLKKRYSFVTVADQDSYELPGNFFRLINSTAWDVTGSWQLDGPRDDSSIVQRDLGNIASGINYSFRVIGAVDQVSTNAEFGTSGGYVELAPAPSEARTISLEYVAANVFMPKQWVTGQAVSIGDLRSANGKVYKSNTAANCGATRPSHTSGTASDGTVTWQHWRGAYETALSDDDIVLFDVNVAVSGLRYQFKRSKGHDFTEELKLFNQAVNASMSRFDGQRVINGESDDLGQFPNLDESYVSTGW